ncbi:MAG TPA: NAD-dependent epimerase/dehydratase family protein [Egibacteraceae bacterium]|nr:NAD-dependent epimerase/dehydratase family protein [Egibacteraceae bacterium]
MQVLVTGSSGLIGSAAVEHYGGRGWEVHGVDNNMRREFFGPSGDTVWNRQRLEQTVPGFAHHDLDIRDRKAVDAIFRDLRFDVVIHCAAQPSHDRAAAIPLVDFDVNATGTVNLLEATRLHAPEAVFIHMSTNKVYGDAPNELPLVELPKRWDYEREEDFDGIKEDFRIDRCLHSLFGASKAAADIVAQEYGRYFGLRTGIFRGGCLTGPRHTGVELHGFLSYLVKVAVRDEEYVVYGYKGKQVRDQIHASDVIAAFDAFAADPRPGEVYNIGGGRQNSASILECFDLLGARLGRPVRWRYEEVARRGDHICYISDLAKLRRDYPGWNITHSLERIIDEILEAELAAAGSAPV